LGGYGFTHTPFPNLSAEALEDELAQTEALLPPRPQARRLVRPPRGATSPLSLLRCARAGYVTALWSRDSDDCRTRLPEEVAAQVSPDSVEPGDVILLHEAQSWTLEALPAILEKLRAARYDLVTVSEIVGFADGPPSGAHAR
ncbi:MAG: polysaccharide deacetylase family protein, partial [Pseudomonadota bacterium]